MRREAERGRGRGRPGSLQLYPTQPSQPPLRFTSSKEEICIWHFGFKNMNITVCHSCSHAPGAPGNPRQTPGVGAGHAPPAWPLPPLQTLSCKTHNKTECSQEPSRLWSSAGSLVPTLGQRGSTPSSSQGTHAPPGIIQVTVPPSAPHPRLRTPPQKKPRRRLAAAVPSCPLVAGRAAGCPRRELAPHQRGKGRTP